MRVWLVLAVVGLSGALALGSGENDSPMGASGIELGDVTTGTVSQPKDPVDWWKVYVPGSGVLVVFLDGAQAHDVDLYFYNSNLDLLAQSTGRGAGRGGIREDSRGLVLHKGAILLPLPGEGGL